MAILALDWGLRRVGVAVSDGLGLMAHPVGTIPAGPGAELAERVRRLAAERGADRIVLGLPRNMDGTEGESAARARRLAEDLRAATGLPVDLWDERLTSWEADRILSGASRPSPEKRKMIRDTLAACLILQGYLDSKKGKG